MAKEEATSNASGLAKQIVNDWRQERIMLVIVAIVFCLLAAICGWTTVAFTRGIGILVFGAMTAGLLFLAAYVLLVVRQSR